MRKIKVKYDEEFKKNAVKLSYADPKGVAGIAKSLGINANLIYNWRRKYTNTGEKTRSATLEEENKELRLENARLRMEADMLKKATAYFANLHK